MKICTRIDVKAVIFQIFLGACPQILLERHTLHVTSLEVHLATLAHSIIEAVASPAMNY